MVLYTDDFPVVIVQLDTIFSVDLMTLVHPVCSCRTAPLDPITSGSDLLQLCLGYSRKKCPSHLTSIQALLYRDRKNKREGKGYTS